MHLRNSKSRRRSHCEGKTSVPPRHEPVPRVLPGSRRPSRWPIHARPSCYELRPGITGHRRLLAAALPLASPRPPERLRRQHQPQYAPGRKDEGHRSIVPHVVRFHLLEVAGKQGRTVTLRDPPQWEEAGESAEAGRQEVTGTNTPEMNSNTSKGKLATGAADGAVLGTLLMAMPMSDIDTAPKKVTQMNVHHLANVPWSDT